MATQECKHCGAKSYYRFAENGTVVKCHKCQQPIEIQTNSSGSRVVLTTAFLAFGFVAAYLMYGRMFGDQSSTATATARPNSLVQDSSLSLRGNSNDLAGMDEGVVQAAHDSLPDHRVFNDWTRAVIRVRAEGGDVKETAARLAEQHRLSQALVLFFDQAQPLDEWDGSLVPSERHQESLVAAIEVKDGVAFELEDLVNSRLTFVATTDSATTATAQIDEPRFYDWTDSTGDRTVSAQVVGMSIREVKLKKSSGDTVMIPLRLFDQSSQNRLIDLLSELGIQASVAEPATN